MEPISIGNVGMSLTSLAREKKSHPSMDLARTRLRVCLSDITFTHHLHIICHLPCLIHILSISKEHVVWLRNLFDASVKAQGIQGNIDAEELFRWVSLKLQSDIWYQSYVVSWCFSYIYIDLDDITFIYKGVYCIHYTSYTWCFMFHL